MSKEPKSSDLDRSLIHEKDENGFTALHLAVWDDLERVKMLLEAGASTRIQDKEGLTPLHCALIWNKMDAAKMLLDYDSKIDIQDRLGRTPLHIAAMHEQLDIVERLLAAGVDTSLPNIKGRTPLHCALMYEQFEAAEILVNSDETINLTDLQGHTPLHWASFHGDEIMVRRLLNAGADARLLNFSASTPLHVALRYKKTDAAYILVDHDAKIDLQDDFFLKTPLHYAARNGIVGIVRKLLEAGANTRLRDINGNTPLHEALIKKRERAAKVLMSFDSEIDLQNYDGRSPLHLAAQCGYLGIVRKLLDAGADIRLKDKDGFTPMCLAKPSAAKILLEADGENDLQGLWGDNSLFGAVLRNDARTLKLQLFCDVHPHRKDCAGQYPLSISSPDTDKLIVSAIVLTGIAIDWEELDMHPDKTRNCMTYLAQCRAEVQLMKETKVNDTNVSYYDLATGSLRKVARYLANGDIRWHWGDGLQDFRNYGELIAFKVKRAEKRRSLSAQCLACFSYLSEKFTFMPQTNMGIILHLLNQRDMQNFVESFMF